MGTQETVSTYIALLKEWYTNDRVLNLVYKTNPFLALCPKMTEFKGKDLPIPIIYGTTPGGSASFTTAVSNKGNSLSKAFALTRVSDYSLASIGREVLKASEGSEGAFMDALKTNVDGALRAATRSLAVGMYRKGTGRRGQISSTTVVSTNLITLANASDVTNFEPLMYIQTMATDGGTLRTGTAQIQSVDRAAGTLTLTTPLTTPIAAAAVGDFILRAGDFNATVSGLDAWLLTQSARPTMAGVDSFFGVDRFADPSRLAGNYYNAQNQSITEAFINGQSINAREGGTADYCFMNNIQYRQFLKEATGKVHYVPTTAEATATVSFSGVEIMGDAGPIKVIPDQNCNANTMYILQMDVCKLYSLGDAPHIFDMDSDQELLRESTTDGYELRTGYYAQLGIRAPGWCTRVELSTAVP